MHATTKTELGSTFRAQIVTDGNTLISRDTFITEDAAYAAAEKMLTKLALAIEQIVRENYWTIESTL